MHCSGSPLLCSLSTQELKVIVSYICYKQSAKDVTYAVQRLVRMIQSEEEDEFVAVRVQDPRVQNEGSWNSYVDFKIFLHTNSKAFTAKTSCVRRRYSEFVWLKKKLQKNVGLVPVPELPGKNSFFHFNNEDFLERRRKGLQQFLDKVLSMTVCLSDSQLHLFLQTQLPLGHIEDCVQGLTPYTVTEAILTYASSNRGWVQEEGGTWQDSLLTVSYESADSPIPHVPSIQGRCKAEVHKNTTGEVASYEEDAYMSDPPKMNRHKAVCSSTNAVGFMASEAAPVTKISNCNDVNRACEAEHMMEPCGQENDVHHTSDKYDVDDILEPNGREETNTTDTHSETDSQSEST
ncbi:sorting nexin-10-like isoform X2 [Paramormyrops kingsleyae]|uniref:sorting nexin-10-like isoform X2 n=1 Tax=Paramormyrops kingsleyae TaxID=1676925 RepID=UPI003B96EF5B